MSKYKQTKSSQHSELDYILYRLDHIERRLDNIEQSSKSNISTELLHVLLDLVKKQNDQPLPQRQPSEAKATHANKGKDEDESNSFDSISCMARRRTVV